MIEREKKRQKLMKRYSEKRKILKQRIASTKSLLAKFVIYESLQKLPRNSLPCRCHNRCIMTGRPKAYYRDFGLSRHVLREMGHQGLLPGLTKSAW